MTLILVDLLPLTALGARTALATLSSAAEPVPFDHDPGVAAIGPFAVHVLSARASECRISA